MISDSKKDHLLTREKWLELAIEAMTGTCMSKFSLDSMFKELPVGKGSFYYHFKNRSEFLIALVDYWDRSETDNVIEALGALPEDTSTEQKLWALMCLLNDRRNYRHELLMHSLALESPELEKAVKKVDRKRFNFLREIMSELGFEGDDLHMRTHMFLTTASMDHFVVPELDSESFQRQLKLRHKFFVGS